MVSSEIFVCTPVEPTHKYFFNIFILPTEFFKDDVASSVVSLFLPSAPSQNKFVS